MYTGMRLGEVLPLRWERVDREALVFRVDETKTGAPLELPITRQLAAILDRRWAESGHLPGGWVFSSASSRTGYFREVDLFPSPHQRGRWRKILVPRAAQLLHHGGRARVDAAARPDQAAGQPCAAQRRHRGYAADWTIGQLRGPAQRIADCIEALMISADSERICGERAAVGSS